MYPGVREGPAQDDQDAAEVDKMPDVVEPNLKVQMRLAFRPAFERLKRRIGSAAVADEEMVWPDVQGDALMLAELMGRLERWPALSVFETPEESQQFQEHLRKVKATDVRRTAAQLYQATRAKDFGQSQELFAMLAQHCNVCHAATPSWSPVVLRP